MFEITGSGFIAALPTVEPDRAHVLLGHTLSVNAANGVLANDTDPIPNDTLSVSAVGGVASNVGHALAGTYGTRLRRPMRLGVVSGDRIRLQEVLVNLISNAVTYAAADLPRWVEVGYEDVVPPDAGQPVRAFYVRDNGTGIWAGQQQAGRGQQASSKQASGQQASSKQASGQQASSKPASSRPASSNTSPGCWTSRVPRAARAKARARTPG